MHKCIFKRQKQQQSLCQSRTLLGWPLYRSVNHLSKLISFLIEQPKLAVPLSRIFLSCSLPNHCARPHLVSLIIDWAHLQSLTSVTRRLVLRSQGCMNAALYTGHCLPWIWSPPEETQVYVQCDYTSGFQSLLCYISYVGSPAWVILNKPPFDQHLPLCLLDQCVTAIIGHLFRTTRKRCSRELRCCGFALRPQALCNDASWDLVYFTVEHRTLLEVFMSTRGSFYISYFHLDTMECPFFERYCISPMNHNMNLQVNHNITKFE